MSSILFPLSFIRTHAKALDATAVFDTLNDLNLYVASDPTAYAGQIVSISGGVDAGVYIISENVDSVIKQAAADDINLQSVTDNNNVTTNDIQVANLSAEGDIYSGSAFTGDVVVGNDTSLSIRGGLIYSVNVVETYSSSAAPAVDVTITPTSSVTPTITPTSSVTPTITPTSSVTPTITPTSSVTLTITPTLPSTIIVTPTITPTSSVTPTITPTISVTPSLSTTDSVISTLTSIDSDSSTLPSILFPISFTRQYAGPLDITAVFATLADLNTYIASDPTAYAGQIVSISGGVDVGVYIISENVDSVIKQAAADDINLQSVTDNNNVTTNDIQVANLSAEGDIYSGSAFTGDVVVGNGKILSIRGGLIQYVTSVETSTTPSISTSVASTVAPTPTSTPTPSPVSNNSNFIYNFPVQLS